MLNSNSEGIEIKGYEGTYYVIDTHITPIGIYFLLESELYGDEVPCILTDSYLNFTYETYDCITVALNEFWTSIE